MKNANKRSFRTTLRNAYLAVPIPFSVKRKIKDVSFTILAPFIKNTETYHVWVNRDSIYDPEEIDTTVELWENVEWSAYLEQIMRIPFSKDKERTFVKELSLDVPMELTENDVKYLAFYLPQFHPFKENDEWWGKGFTEWTNVTKAVPQFVGHFQPRLAGELGYYDLRNCDVMKRQIELAKKYGVYGFCIYYYWFNGKTLMEGPLQILLSNPDLQIPFSLCWANENWSRRWDGKENDILIAQKYDEEFPLKFIKDVAKYMEDPRYIRIDGKLLFVVYNAKQIPNLSQTLTIWRNFIREIGLGELHLLAVDFALTPEAKNAGFDGFIEFPPHSVDPYLMPTMNSSLSFISKNCRSRVYDYQQIVNEKKYLSQNVDKYYKGIFMAWDNSARKPYNAAVYHNYSPKAFKEWLKDITILTKESRKTTDRLVFINAWNEWAEGTYLEPDGKYGYANLNVVRDVLLESRRACRKIIYVSHDAWFNGAQLLSLNIIKQLKETFGYEVYTILLSGGVLKDEFIAASDRLLCVEEDTKCEDDIVQWINKCGATKALCNTVVTGDMLKLISSQKIECISMIHEMENVIHQYNCEEKLIHIAKYAKKIVFASDYVRESVEKIHSLPKEKIVIQPQGMYKLNTLMSKKDNIRRIVREEYQLPENAKVVLAVGYGDYRKGIDLFIKTAAEVCKQMEHAYFMWVGNIDATMKSEIEALMNEHEIIGRVIFTGPQTDIMKYYTASDLYLLTSREDPFPTVVMEAMDSELPVIAFRDGGGYVENIMPTTGRLVDMEDYVSMAREIIGYLDSDKMRKEHGICAREYVEAKFNFVKYVNTLLGLLKEEYHTVSVVVPNYNYEEYLRMRLDSVLGQTYPITEVIVLDDASTDGSRAIIEEYREKYPLKVKVCMNDKNSGSVFAQWEKGLAMASGEYVWIAEADDLATPDFISRLVDKMEQCQAPILAYSQSYMIDSDGQITAPNYWCYTDDVNPDIWHKDYILDSHKEVTEHMSVKNTIPNVSAVLFKNADFSKAILEAKKYTVAGDWAFYVEVMRKQGEVCFVSDSLNYHRRHANSVTTDLKAKKHFDEICQMQDTVCAMYPGEVDLEKVRRYRDEVRKTLNV
ncbi:MAG: glycosyltransferase [Lachnoclostridium sp.]|nr:glycosyltransferase [Lachnoclostridium sp.]